MPYNTTPITPSKEATGTVTLPLTRVKRIIQTDEDVSTCATSAAFLITIATEIFVQYLAERSFDIVKAEKRGKKSLQYADIANAVSRIDNLDFLADVVPKTTTYKRFIAERGKDFQPGSNARSSLAEHPAKPSARVTQSSAVHEKEDPVQATASTANADDNDAMQLDQGEYALDVKPSTIQSRQESQ